MRSTALSGLPLLRENCSARPPLAGVYFAWIAMKPSANVRIADVRLVNVDVDEVYVPGWTAELNVWKNASEIGVMVRVP